MGVLTSALRGFVLATSLSSSDFLDDPTPPRVPASGTEPTLEFLFTGATRGTIDGFRNRKSEPRLGSLARRMTALRELRARRAPVLYFDVGSTFFPPRAGTPPASVVSPTVERARLIARTLRRAGCDAVAIGSADLAFGLDRVRELERQVEFPFLCANLIDVTIGRSSFLPSAEFERGGVKIGVLALLDSRRFAPHPADRDRFRVEPAVESARTHLPDLRARNDLVVILCEFGSPLEALAAIPGVDGVISVARDPG